nr:mAb 8C7-reactive major allergen {N-terminal, band 1} [Parietaria officinalis, pollen, Peptide Partial, 15 aa] [Parietaria officinalis]
APAGGVVVAAMPPPL